ncbi:gamma-glutamyltransferase [Arthrobacter sp. H14]|uniref:gamma-glutamyltransferase n=1 Tax=Arthrobacter sp. H14 TaxID=1312959 RepID=UPI00047A676D|nr:gamma-glutamyltransferase [Arthrobacter sp. H14]
MEAIVSSNDRATEAGNQILAAGGTAADASVAVAAVLSVVEPFYSSVLGGGTWGLYFDANEQAVTSVNGDGPVGSEATLADSRPRAGSSARTSCVGRDGHIVDAQHDGASR